LFLDKEVLRDNFKGYRNRCLNSLEYLNFRQFRHLSPPQAD
jgi:hypothetical protein